MLIGVPKEIKTHEYRVAMTPVGVEELTRAGHQVLIETGAGLGSGILDEQYSKHGAEMVADTAAVWNRADLIVKVKEPQPDEWPLMRSGQIVFTYFHFAADEALTRAVMKSGITAIAFFAALGLPGLSAFISEVLVLLGAWQRYPVLTIVGATAVVLTAGYMLWTLQRIWLGKVNEKYADMPDVAPRELFTLVPLAAIVIVLGVYPTAILDLMTTSLDQLNGVVANYL